MIRFILAKEKKTSFVFGYFDASMIRKKILIDVKNNLDCALTSTNYLSGIHTNLLNVTIEKSWISFCR